MDEEHPPCPRSHAVSASSAVWSVTSAHLEKRSCILVIEIKEQACGPEWWE